jgi:hypothetical protein
VAEAEISARSVRAKNVRRLAGQIVAQLYLTTRLMQLYEGEHENVRAALESLLAKLGEFFASESAVRLSVDGGYLFANDVRLRVDRAAAEAFDWLLDRFAESGVSSVAFGHEVRPIELRKFLPIFARASWPENGPPPDLARQLSDGFVLNVTLTMRRHRDLAADGDHEDPEVSARELAVQLWLKLHAAASALTEAAESGGALSLRGVRSLVQLAVDALVADEAALLAMTQQKCYVPPGVEVENPAQVYLESHLVNTCLLSLGVGNRLGLGRLQLLDLGTAALTAGIGMVFIPREIRERAGPISLEERDAVGRAPLLAAEAIMRLDEWSAVNRLCAAVAAAYSPALHQKLGARGRTALFAAIVALADAFDAMTTDRPWRRAIGHEEALRELVEATGPYRPLLAKIFANLVGVAPAGSIVELTTGEVGIVVEQQRRPELAARPKVKLLLDANGRGVTGKVVDLAEPGPHGGFRRGIERVLELKRLASGPGDLVALL